MKKSEVIHAIIGKMTKLNYDRPKRGKMQSKGNVWDNRKKLTKSESMWMINENLTKSEQICEIIEIDDKVCVILGVKRKNDVDRANLG